MKDNYEGRWICDTHTRITGKLKAGHDAFHGTCSDGEMLLAGLTKRGAWPIYFLITSLQDQGMTKLFPQAFS